MTTLVASVLRGQPISASSIVHGPFVAEIGTIVVARVHKIGCYPVMETYQGGETDLSVGDTLIGVTAHRWSSTSLYGTALEGRIEPGSRADLLAVGGIIGRCSSTPPELGEPTALEIIGCIGTVAQPRRVRLSTVDSPLVATPSVLVVGTAAEVGKTTLAAGLIRGLTGLGIDVGAAKLTGTGRMRDIVTMRSAGARSVGDFVDAGLATTYGTPPEQLKTMARHVLHSVSQDVDVIVVEFGGDVLGGGARHLIQMMLSSARIVGIACCATDALAASAAWQILLEWGAPAEKLVIGPTRRNRMAFEELIRVLNPGVLVEQDTWALCQRYAEMLR